MPSKLLLSFCFFVAMFSCEKTEKDDATNLVNLAFITTATPASQIQGQAIFSQVRCIEPDLCYRFSNFEIQEAGMREFNIRAKGTYPSAKSGIACAQIVTFKDTTVKIQAATKGQYLLHFYNQNQLFNTDTVQVN